jgi:plastocyanin
MNKPGIPIILIGILIALSTAGTARGATNTVTFGSFFFNPKVVTINVGDTVVWNNSGGFHTVTGTGSEPLCGTDSVPVSCVHTFLQPGNYSYQCNVAGHAGLGMTGLVQVLAPVVMPAVLTNFTILANGHAQFTVNSTVSRTNLVQASASLAVSNWLTISTVVPATNTFVVTDSNAPAFQLRFYRVVQP